MTCDVEDYFQVSAFEHVVDRSRWGHYECRLPQNIDRVLQIFSDRGVQGTFFTLGWVASNYPELVRRISDEGHEIASHGMRHERVWRQSPDEFHTDALESKKLLEDVTGKLVTGYRAASWSMDSRTPWAHEVLAEAGYRYSSSLYPISHDHYGTPHSPAHPFFTGAADLLEIPASTASFFGKNLPAAGGGYFRLFPLMFSRWLMVRASTRGTLPVVFYFHPWELDPAQPRMGGISSKARFRHYINLSRFERRLVSLLKDFAWSRMDRVFLDDRP